MADRHVEYAIVGGGLAAANCAFQLRRSGADGQVLVIGRESDLPYDRPCPEWTRRLESEIGLIRQKGTGKAFVWLCKSQGSKTVRE